MVPPGPGRSASDGVGRPGAGMGSRVAVAGSWRCDTRASEGNMSGSTSTTHGVRVDVEPHYLAAHSDPARHRTGCASPTPSRSRTTVSRPCCGFWRGTGPIRDAHGTEEHVRGPGVVGEQPVLQPGQSFRYVEVPDEHTGRDDAGRTRWSMRTERASMRSCPSPSLNPTP